MKFFRNKLSYGRFLSLNILGAVMFLLVCNQEWALTPAGYIDPWVYINFFRDFGNLNGSPDLAGNYKATRIPWLLFGNVGVNVFGVEVFQVLLPLSHLVALGGLGYLIVRRVGVEYGVIAGSFLALSPVFHGSGSWLYQNSLTGPLQLASILMITRLTARNDARTAKLPKQFWELLPAGALSALLAITSPVQSLVLIPYLLAAICLDSLNQWDKERGLKGFTRRLAVLLLGALCGVLLCSLASIAGGGRFDFWAPTQNLLVEMMRTRIDTRWHQDWSSGWLWSASWLALPTFGAVLALVRLTIWTISKPAGISALAILLNVGHLGASALWSILYFAFQIHVLNWNYHAYPLTLTAVLAIFGGFRSLQTRFLSRLWFSLAIWLPAFSLAIPVFWIRLDLSEFGTIFGGSFATSILILACVYTAVTAVYRWLPREKRSVLVLGAIGLTILISTQDRSSYSLFEDCHVVEIGNRAVLNISEQFESNASPVYLFALESNLSESVATCSIPPHYLVSSLSAISPFSSTSWSTLDSVPGVSNAKALMFSRAETDIARVLKSLGRQSLLFKPRCEVQPLKVEGLEIWCLELGSR